MLASVNLAGLAVQAEIFDASEGFQGFPIQGNEFLVLSSGVAANADDGSGATFDTDILNGDQLQPGAPQSDPRSNPQTSFDVVTLSLDFDLPVANQIVLSFDWKFATEEIPEFTTTFPDYFRADVFTSSGVTNIAELNGSFVNSATAATFSNPVGGGSSSSPPAADVPNDVVFNAVTTNVQTSTIDLTQFGGETVTVQFRVADVRDAQLNSAAFIDNLDITVGFIDVTVLDPSSYVAEDVFVTVVNNDPDFGPFRVPGDLSSFTGGLTDAQGMVRIGGLPLGGNYCVHVGPFTDPDDRTADGNFIVPATEIVGDPQPVVGAIYDGNGSVAFTANNYVQNCLNNPPISLTLADPTEQVQLQLQGAECRNVSLKDVAGNPVSLPIWVALQIALPWFDQFDDNLPVDILPGILVYAGPEDGSTEVCGTPDEDAAVETQVIDQGDQGTLSLSREFDFAQGGQQQLSFTMEPQMCTVDKKDEPKGDVRKPNGIDIGPFVKDGFRADAQLNKLDEVSIFYDQMGDGEVKLHLQIDPVSGGDRLNLIARADCQSGDCEAGKVNGSAIDAGVEVLVFFADQGDNTIRVTWRVKNIPDALNVRYQLQAAGEKFPEVAFTDIRMTEDCLGGLSNDPRFWIGG